MTTLASAKKDTQESNAHSVKKNTFEQAISDVKSVTVLAYKFSCTF